MKIAIVGHGFVGKAFMNALNDNIETYIVDPKLNTSLSDLVSFVPDMIFICVPTPMNMDGSQDVTIINKVIKEIIDMSIDSLIIIKSTVLPDNLLEVQKLIPKVIYNPEFLREAHANDDFINADLIILGGSKAESKKLSKFYDEHTKCLSNNYFFTDITTASYIKYTINSFLSMKVIFFNELKGLFEETDSNDSWEEFINILSFDKRIGDSHMQVPGPDGKYGYGGACFPKDTNALLKYSKSKNKELKVLKKVAEINNLIRGQYIRISEREKEQNIHFEEK